MKNLYLIALTGAVMRQACLAEEPPAATTTAAPEAHTPVPVYTEPVAIYFGGTEPNLNAQESASVGITRAWADKSYQAMLQTPGQDGSVRFKYGEALPTIVCAVLQVTDLELEPGEVVNDKPFLGDTERWVVEPAVSGSADVQTQHLIIKPRDVGLSTTLVIPTDRRTYHLALLSTKGAFIHHVSFTYPGSSSPAPKPAAAPSPKPATPAVKVALAEAEPAPTPAARKARVEQEGKGAVRETSLEDSGYHISGRAPWKPERVYNNGRQTFIEMPADVSSKEAPALFVLRKGGPFGLGKQHVLCNYRVHGRWWVADAVIDQAELVAGVGSNRDRVTITRESK